MRSIIPDIHDLMQHLKTISSSHKVYRPEQCPSCGLDSLWNHGAYSRKSDRENPPGKSLNPVTIPRFYCPGCGHTCSVLPECIPPKRWYLWAIQQAALIMVLSGSSYRKVSHALPVSRHTVSRWVMQLHEQFNEHIFQLKSKLPWLGRFVEFNDAWQALLEHTRLSTIMLWLNYMGVIVP